MMNQYGQSVKVEVSIFPRAIGRIFLRDSLGRCPPVETLTRLDEDGESLGRIINAERLELLGQQVESDSVDGKPHVQAFLGCSFDCVVNVRIDLSISSLACCSDVAL